MTKNNYSLYNSYNAEFGVGQYFANKAAKDMKSVMGSGATQEVIDDVVKRAIDSGEKQVTQKAQRLGKKVRRLWKASPKLRRNVKLAGVAGAGLVGLNALTGLKTVYDIGKGIKNKVMPKKQQNAQYSLFNPYAVEFARNQQTQEQPKKKSLVKKGLKYAAIGGAGLVGLGAAKRYGGEALKYRKALARDANIKYAMKNNQPIRVPSFQELADLDMTIANNGAKGKIKRDGQWISNRLKRTPKNNDPFAGINID